MANLGIALGSGFNTFTDSFSKGLAAAKQIKDYWAESDLKDALDKAPKVGDTDTTGQAAAVAAEQKRLGIPDSAFKAGATMGDRIGSINQMRSDLGGEGNQGSFAAPAARVYTQADRDAAIATALQNTGDPRNMALASQMQTNSLQQRQMQRAESRDALGDMARRSIFQAEAGDNEGALRTMQDGYNQHVPDGNTVKLRMDGDHVVGDVTGANGQTVTRRFPDVKTAAQTMYSMSSPQAYEAFLAREQANTLADKGIAAHHEDTRTMAGATMGAARIHADAALGEEKMRQDTEMARMKVLTPLYTAQTADAQSGADYKNMQTGDLKKLNTAREEFYSLAAKDPNDPQLVNMGSKLGALDPHGMVEVTERGTDPTTGAPVAKGVLKNRYLQTLEELKPTPTSPGQVDAIAKHLMQKYPKGLSDEQLRQEAAAFDATPGRHPGSFAQIVSQLPPTVMAKNRPAVTPRTGIPSTYQPPPSVAPNLNLP